MSSPMVALLQQAPPSDLLAKAVQAARPDAIVDQLTALSARNSEAKPELRIHGTRNLVDAALAAGTRRIVAQSIAWAYAPSDTPAVETHPFDTNAGEPRSIIVNGVRSLEATVAELPEPVVLRYGTLYGPGTWYANDGYMADKAKAEALAADDSVTSFAHVADAGAACRLALGWDACTANICDDQPAAASEWVPPLRPLRRRARTNAPTRAPAWARGADNHFARHTLGWSPRLPTWRDGFRTGL